MITFVFNFGLVLVIIGLFFIFYVILKSLKLKKEIKLKPNSLNEFNLDLQKLLPINLLGIFFSFIGIMVIVLVFILT